MIQNSNKKIIHNFSKEVMIKTHMVEEKNEINSFDDISSWKNKYSAGRLIGLLAAWRRRDKRGCNRQLAKLLSMKYGENDGHIYFPMDLSRELNQKRRMEDQLGQPEFMSAKMINSALQTICGIISLLKNPNGSIHIPRIESVYLLELPTELNIDCITSPSHSLVVNCHDVANCTRTYDHFTRIKIRLSPYERHRNLLWMWKKGDLSCFSRDLIRLIGSYLWD